MAETIVSEKIISSKVVKKKNPISQKLSEFSSSCKGLLIAPFLILIGFGLIFYSEGFNRDSKLVAKLELTPAQEISADAGLAKISGVANVSSRLEAPEVGDVLYYSYKLQKYQEVQKKEYETRTRVENGETIEDTVEIIKLVDEWVDQPGSDSKWAEFSLGNISIKPTKANNKLKLISKEFRSNYYGEFSETASVNQNAQIGDQRILISYAPTSEELIVIGEVTNSMIEDGKVFIITNSSDSELLASLESSESMTYWIAKVAALVLIASGLIALIKPILVAVDMIPVAGDMVNSVATIIAIIISAIIVLVASIAIKFWWIFLILLVLFIAFAGGIGYMYYKKKVVK